MLQSIYSPILLSPLLLRRSIAIKLLLPTERASPLQILRTALQHRHQRLSSSHRLSPTSRAGRAAITQTQALTNKSNHSACLHQLSCMTSLKQMPALKMPVRCKVRAADRLTFHLPRWHRNR